MPNLVQTTLPAIDWPTEVESRIVRANERFESGKREYQRGDLEAARRDFNRALDILLTAPDNLPNRQKLERRLDDLSDLIYRYDLDELGSGEKRTEVVYDKSPLDGILEMTFPIDPSIKSKVLDEIAATVSQLPLEMTDEVLGYIHYFSTDRGKKVLTSGLKRAGRYKPLIQRILDEEGVPQELIYLAQAESGFLPRAVSYKQATGMWQFVQFRGREYGLDQTPGSDDRLDPEKATRAAAKHLHDLYSHFGDWYLAMAAYNCGPGCVDHAIQRTGYADFWELSRLNVLPKQTINYVPLILAMTIMGKNPKDYGLEEIDPDQPIEYDTLPLKSATSLSLIADVADRPIAEIRDLNPALLKSVAPAGYAVHIPKGSLSPVLTALENVPQDKRASWRMHRVERGETLAQIAKQFNTPATTIASVNNRFAEAPEEGDFLIIPATYTPDAPAVKLRAHTSSSHGVSGRTTSSRRAAIFGSRGRTGRSSSQKAAAQRLPDRVLHKKAAAKTIRTANASLSSSRGAE
ncbi:MAG TPA: transglycosylase SLT domain-containing protein [Bryobacteraceae bacterium]|nr:transglycosylase SLT domain-containing protein [Bryobacteraceae bacterium]